MCGGAFVCPVCFSGYAAVSAGEIRRFFVYFPPTGRIPLPALPCWPPPRNADGSGRCGLRIRGVRRCGNPRRRGIPAVSEYRCFRPPHTSIAVEAASRAARPVRFYRPNYPPTRTPTTAHPRWDVRPRPFFFRLGAGAGESASALRHLGVTNSSSDDQHFYQSSLLL